MTDRISPGKVFLDTNVLVYALAAGSTASSDRRTQVAEDLLAAGGVVSVQILNEFVDVAARKLRLSWGQIENGLQAVEALCGRATSISADTHALAVTLSSRYGFRIYDSMIVAAALEAGCATLYTEDLQHGQQIEGLQVRNPFIESA